MKLKHAAQTLLLLILACSLFLAQGKKIPYLDEKTEAYFSDTMTKAALAYGVCRLVNASVSVLKESQIQIEPAGLGVSLAAGQILDPLDDMTERASDILVTAIVSLGFQKIAYELSITFMPLLLAIFLVAFIPVSFSHGRRAQTIQQTLIKTMVLFTVARLLLPLSSLVSFTIHEQYFTPQITKAKDNLTLMSPTMPHLQDSHMPEIDGVLGTVKNGFTFVGEKAADLQSALKTIQKNMGNMITNLLTLSYLYVALFLIQVILIPVGICWLLMRLFTSLFSHATSTEPPCKKERQDSVSSITVT